MASLPHPTSGTLRVNFSRAPALIGTDRRIQAEALTDGHEAVSRTFSNGTRQFFAAELDIWVSASVAVEQLARARRAVIV